jgi:glycosyltransferase involved in cell wall biosynthesis
MKILYLHQYFKKPSMNGGIRSYEFAKRLVRDGHDVSIITSDTENVFSGWKIENIDGIKVHWISIQYRNDFSFLKRLWAFFKFLVQSSIYLLKMKSDILIATSTPLTVAIPAIIYKKIKRKPFVFEVRDVWPEVPIALGFLNNRFLRFIAIKLEQYAYSNASSIIALSPDMKKSIEGKVPNKPIYVIPNASDISLFNLQSNYKEQDTYKKLATIKVRHKKIVFYTGTFGLVNNLQFLLKLACYSKGDIGFVIIGSGKEKSELEQIASQFDILNKTVYILDAIPKKELYIVHHLFDLATSTVLPIPALYANSANKIFDAFASGTPVLINHAGWIESLIIEYGCGIALSGEANQIEYDKLSTFLFSNFDYSNACLASSKLGENNFNRENLYLKFKKVLEGTC